MSKPNYYTSEDSNFTLMRGDSLKLLPKLELNFDLVFADPPYFLSNNGKTIHSGKIVNVNKGEWDKSRGLKEIYKFNKEWLKLVKNVMAPHGSIFISGTQHNIFSIGTILQELDFKILNIITWQKTNPPPHFACRYFTHSTEQIIWARKSSKVAHYFNYELMKKLNDNKQMKDVWTLPAISPWEKKQGKHPTQKPLSVLTRIILAATQPDALILDPFAGSSTTGIAANLLDRRYIGIEKEETFLEISRLRKMELDNLGKEYFFTKIKDLKTINIDNVG